MDTVAKSLYAGMMIGLGGTIYLSCDNKYIGAFLFAIGLWSILNLGLYLFTGKVCSLTDNKPLYALWLVPVWLGNFLGTFLVALAVRYSRIAPELVEKAKQMVDIKLNDDPISILVLSVGCGMMMYLAVWTHATAEHSSIREFAAPFIPISVFILSGFEHCIANMFYISLADAWDTRALIYVLLMTLGNALGGLIGPILYKISMIGKKEIPVGEPKFVHIPLDENMSEEEVNKIIDDTMRQAKEDILETHKKMQEEKDKEDR